jgi:short-subunit dehydrogenase
MQTSSPARTVAIVGAGPGISQAVAQRFAREGYAIGLIARNAGRLATQAELLRQGGAEAEFFPADVADTSALQAALSGLSLRFGAPGVLLYNAVQVRPSLPSQLDPEQLIHDFRVNVAGLLTSVQAVLPAMRSAHSGTVLITGGGLALAPNAAVASLAAGKAALRNLALSLHQELTPLGIHVATVTVAGLVQPGTLFAPGAIAERFWELHDQESEFWQHEVIFDGLSRAGAQEASA